MKELELFKYNLRFQSWGELYLGCKAKWITPQDAVCFYENNKVKANEEDFVSLYLALDDSYHQFLEQLKTLVSKNENITISKNEDELDDCVFNYIPQKYFKIWELEYLLEAISLPISVSDKLHEVASLFDKMNYPEEWKPFLYYQQLFEKGNMLDENTLYQNLIDYIEEQKENYKS